MKILVSSADPPPQQGLDVYSVRPLQGLDVKIHELVHARGGGAAVLQNIVI